MKSAYVELFKTSQFATIDPGLTTAIQFWNCGKMQHLETFRPSSKAKTFNDVLDSLTDKISFTHTDYALIEAVDFRVTSEVSVASASRGNLSLLAYIVGAIAHRVIIDDAEVLEPVKYVNWAGQLSYTQLRKYLKMIGIETRNDHCAAAIGMGLWAKGEL